MHRHYNVVTIHELDSLNFMSNFKIRTFRCLQNIYILDLRFFLEIKDNHLVFGGQANFFSSKFKFSAITSLPETKMKKRQNTAFSPQPCRGFTITSTSFDFGFTVREQ